MSTPADQAPVAMDGGPTDDMEAPSRILIMRLSGVSYAVNEAMAACRSAGRTDLANKLHQVDVLCREQIDLLYMAMDRSSE